MDSPQDTVESYKRLSEALGNLLEGRSHELTVAQADNYSLLVLETSRDSVGFAVVNGTPEPSFTSAYDSFKQLYRERHTAWKERNLSFVVCRSELESTYDAFFSSIESDIYFCRKYVVYLRRNQDELVRELQRLPFLPLPEGRVGGILRPPSAQTLLQSLNVSARIARQIIVPLEYSANRIVDELLGGNEPLPVIGTTVDQDVERHTQSTEITRVKSLEIEAFRAYKKKQEFDVDADLVVFYGPNGLGKTSFFDALDYVCTGRIGRLCRRRVSQNEFMDLARHLASTPNEGYVSMQFSQGTSVRSVRRDVTDWGTALIGDDKHDRASTLQILTSSHWEPKKARIENLERLFRATHLFGQSDPELLVEFEADSTLSSDLVHRMLALEDYASGLSKATAIVAQLDKQIFENKQQTSVLNARENELQSKIKALREPSDNVEAGKQLREMATTLVRDLHAYANVTIAEIEPSQESAREWRAMAESAAKDALDQLHQLQSAESTFAQFTENGSTLRNIMVELPKLESILREKIVDRTRQQEAIKQLQQSLEQQRLLLAQVNSRFQNLNELRGLQEVHQKTGSTLRQWQLEMSRVARETEQITAELQPLLPVAEDLRNRTRKLRELVEAAVKKVEALTAIQRGLPSLEINRAKVINLEQSAASMRSSLESLSTAMDELNKGIAVREKELATCKQEYDSFASNQLEMTRLLDEIEAHVESGICPTCGIDHKSKDALIERIHAQKQTRPANVEELAKQLSELQKTLRQNESTIAPLRSELASKTRELDEIESKLSDVHHSVALFEGRVTEARLPLDGDLTAIVGLELNKEKTTLEHSREMLRNLESELASSTLRINELERKGVEQVEARKRARSAIMPLEQQVAELRAKAEALGLSMDFAPEESIAESQAVTSRKLSAEEQIRGLSSQIDKISPAANAADRQIKELTEKINSLRRDKGRLEEAVLRYEEMISSLIDRNALSLEAIVKQKNLTEKRVDSLDSLKKRCLTFERTVDAAKRSALLAELETQTQTLTREKQTLDEAAERISAVTKWVASIKDALERQSSVAVSDHVEAFGPLTSLIQKRLRSVYGFGDISLLAKGNEIRVVVDWKTKQLKPADYFSDSQKQILMLSLFLAGRLTQTWSGFAPILMDDPVTHFDDLNAFGFVELIRGLTAASPGKRQFFISTCEDRLFRLMLQKFQGEPGRAKFFRFEGIGPDGPVIKDDML